MYDCALMYGPNHLVTPSLNDQREVEAGVMFFVNVELTVLMLC